MFRRKKQKRNMIRFYQNIYKLREKKEMLVIWTGNEQVQVNLAAMLQYDLRESYTMIRYLRLRGDVFTKNKVYMLLYNSC